MLSPPVHAASALEASSNSANIMLLIDSSSSMLNIVPEAPYDPNTTYPCASDRTLTPLTYNEGGIVDLIVDKATNYAYPRCWNCATGKPTCFSPDKVFRARLTDRASAIDLPAVYSGNYLNWYFGEYASGNPWGKEAVDTIPGPGRFRVSPHSFQWGGSHGGAVFYRKPGTRTRLEVAKAAALKLIDELDNARIGFASLTTHGAVINLAINDVSEHENNLKAAIKSVDGRETSGWQSSCSE
jgi:hypothetical protein